MTGIVYLPVWYTVVRSVDVMLRTAVPVCSTRIDIPSADAAIFSPSAASLSWMAITAFAMAACARPSNSGPVSVTSAIQITRCRFLRPYAVYTRLRRSGSPAPGTALDCGASVRAYAEVFCAT